MNQTDAQKQFEDGLAEFEMQDCKNQEPEALTDLSWIGRRIRLITDEVEKTVEYEKAETEKISACCNARCLTLSSYIEDLGSMAKNVLVAHGYAADGKLKSYKMPGIGKFSMGLTREAVDESAYKDMTAEEQKALQAEQPSLFSERVSIAPNKGFILELLKDDALKTSGARVERAGFRLRERAETFKFKEE